MISKLFAAWCLLALTVMIHAGGLAVLLRRCQASQNGPDSGFWPVMWVLVRLAWCLILIHLAEIAVWALFYWWQGCLPDAESSFYFSGVTYTTGGIL